MVRVQARLDVNSEAMRTRAVRLREMRLHAALTQAPVRPARIGPRARLGSGIEEDQVTEHGSSRAAGPGVRLTAGQTLRVNVGMVRQAGTGRIAATSIAAVGARPSLPAGPNPLAVPSIVQAARAEATQELRSGSGARGWLRVDHRSPLQRSRGAVGLPQAKRAIHLPPVGAPLRALRAAMGSPTEPTSGGHEGIQARMDPNGGPMGRDAIPTGSYMPVSGGGQAAPPYSAPTIAARTGVSPRSDMGAATSLGSELGSELGTGAVAAAGTGGGAAAGVSGQGGDQGLVLHGSIMVDGRRLGQLAAQAQGASLSAAMRGPRGVNLRATPVPGGSTPSLP